MEKKFALFYFCMCVIVSLLAAIPFSQRIHLDPLQINEAFRFFENYNYQATVGGILIIIGVGGFFTLNELFKTSIAITILGVILFLVVQQF